MLGRLLILTLPLEPSDSESSMLPYFHSLDYYLTETPAPLRVTFFFFFSLKHAPTFLFAVIYLPPRLTSFAVVGKKFPVGLSSNPHFQPNSYIISGKLKVQIFRTLDRLIFSDTSATHSHKQYCNLGYHQQKSWIWYFALQLQFSTFLAA